MARPKAAPERPTNITHADVPLLPWEQPSEVPEELPTDEVEAAGAGDEAEEAAPDEAASLDVAEAEDDADELPPDSEVEEQPDAIIESTPDPAKQLQADYTRKAQALADERKKFEAEAAATRAKRDDYAQRLDALGKLLDAQGPKPPSPDLRHDDPAEYAAQWAEYIAAKADRDEVQRQLDAVNSESDAEQKAEWTRAMENANAIVLEAIPEWKDEAVALADKKKMATIAMQSYGFAPQELERITDPRLVFVLRDAAKYRELSAIGKEKVGKKIEAAPVLKPGARKPVETVDTARAKAIKDARAKANRTGSVNDWARVFELEAPADD